MTARSMSILAVVRQRCVQKMTFNAARQYSTLNTNITIQSTVKSRKGAPTLVQKNMPVSEVAKIMADDNVGCAMVMDGSKVHGIVTERDFLRKVVVKNLKATNVSVGDISTKDIIAVDEGASVGHCMSLMSKEGLRHLPVVKGGAMVDVISIRDLVMAIHEDSKAEIKYLKEYIGFQTEDDKESANTQTV